MFKITYDFMAYSAQAGVKSMRQQYSNEISSNDILYILLFTGLVSLLFCLGCITCCMGRTGVAVVICLIAVVVVVVAALIYEN